MSSNTPELIEERTLDPDGWVGCTVAALTFLDPDERWPEGPTPGAHPGHPAFDDLCVLLRLTAARGALAALRFVLGEVSAAEVLAEEVEQCWLDGICAQLDRNDVS